MSIRRISDMFTAIIPVGFLSWGEFGRFWKYSNFRLCLILLLLLGPRVARCGEDANVKTARHVFCVDLVLRGCSC